MAIEAQFNTHRWMHTNPHTNTLWDVLLEHISSSNDQLHILYTILGNSIQ